MYYCATARAIIIDPSAIFYEGARSYLSQGGCMVLEHTPSLDAAMREFGTHIPNVAVLGPNLSEPASLAICRELVNICPGLKIVIFTIHNDDLLFQTDAASAGANACLPSTASSEGFISAIEGAMAGYQLFSRAIITQEFRAIGLTTREKDVLEIMNEEKTDREIAAKLGISYATVRNHSRHILDKLRVHDRHEAMRRAKRLGWVF